MDAKARLQRLGAAALIFALIFAVLGSPGRVQAEGKAIIVRTSVDDAIVNGNCTLREAIIAANTNRPVDKCPAGVSADVIILTESNYYLSVGGPGEDSSWMGDLDVTAPLTIKGPASGATIWGFGDQVEYAVRDRTLHILPSARAVKLMRVSLQGGRAEVDGVGIFNEAILEMSDGSVSDHRMGEYVGYRGGGIFNAGTLRLTRVQVNDNQGSRGAGIYNQNVLYLTDSQVNGNLADYDNVGGGIYNEYQATIAESEVSENIAAYAGGIYNHNYLHVSNSRLERNFARFYNGALENQGEAILLNVDIHQNYSGHAVGAILNGKRLTIRYSRLDGNFSYGDVGAVISWGSLNLFDVTFSNNHAGGKGGAMSLGGKAELVNVRFDDNFSEAGEGGALYIYSDMVLEQCSLTGNQADRGGAIYQSGGTVVVRASTLENNRANQSGGAIFQEGGTLTLDSTQITNNTALGNGGGLYSAGQTTIESSAVVGNQAGADGAGIYTTGQMTIHQSQVNGNTSEDDGGAVYNSGTLSLAASQVAGNWAWSWTDWFGGGGIANTGDLVIEQSSIEGNWTIAPGGGISNTGNVEVRDSSFAGNVARDWAGGIWHGGGHLTAVNVTFTENRGDGAGSGLGMDGGSANLLNLTFSKNIIPIGWSKVGGGGIAIFHGEATIQNTILAGNVSYYDPNAVLSGLDCYLSSEAVIYNLGNNLVGITDGCNWPTAVGDQTGTVAQPLDPRLLPYQEAGGLTRVMPPAFDSPTLDAGAADACPPADQRGAARPQGGGCDVGAVEALVSHPVMDIKPGSPLNQINLAAEDQVAAVIFSTPDFSAPERVEVDTVTFGRSGNEASLASQDGKLLCARLDVNADSLTDLVCTFYVAQTGLQCGDTVAVFHAYGPDRELIEAQDSVQVLPCP